MITDSWMYDRYNIRGHGELSALLHNKLAVNKKSNQNSMEEDSGWTMLS